MIFLLPIQRKSFECSNIREFSVLDFFFVLSEWMPLSNHFTFQYSNKFLRKRVAKHIGIFFIYLFFMEHLVLWDVWFFSRESRKAYLVCFLSLFNICFLCLVNGRRQINVGWSMSRTSYISHKNIEVKAAFSVTNAHTFSSWTFSVCCYAWILRKLSRFWFPFRL